MQNIIIPLSDIPEEIRQPHLDWLRQQFPHHGTYFKTTQRFIITRTQPMVFTDTTIMKKSEILRLIRSITSQIAYHQTHELSPSAPAYFTPDDIIQYTTTTAITPTTCFMISPNKFLPIAPQTQTIALYNLPPTSSPYVPPDITKIPAILPAQAAYYSLGKLAATLWHQSDSPEMLRIDKKIGQFVNYATVPEPSARQLLWDTS